MQRYEYTGAERVGASIGLDLTDLNARWLDPALGRFTSVDALAHEMPWTSSYTYAFNNPISFTDPTGLSPRYIMTSGGEGDTYDQGYMNRPFEASESSMLSSAYEWVGTVGEEQERSTASGQLRIGFEGGWRLKGRAPIPEGGHTPYGMLGPVEDNWAGSIKRSGLIGNAAYSFVNPLYVTGQALIYPKTEISNLNGTGVNQGGLNDAVASTAASALPYMRTAVVAKAAIPAGLGFARLNAAQYSSRFKGTAFARMSPAWRGRLNRTYNTGVGYANSKLQSGGALLNVLTP